MKVTEFATTKFFRIIFLSFCLILLISFQSLTHVSTSANATPASQADPSLVGQWTAPITWNCNQDGANCKIVAIHMHLLPNGKVLAWQNKDNALELDTYLVDPDTGNSTTIHNPYTQVFCAGHAFLPDGRLLVSGGHHIYNGVGEPHTNIFDFNTNTWTRVSDMNLGRWYPTNTTLGNGEVLVVSGTYWDGTLNPDGSPHTVQNQTPQVWQITGNWRTLSNAIYPMQLYPWMFVAPNGLVFNPGPDQVTRFLDTNGLGWWSGSTMCDVSTMCSNYGFRGYGSSVMYDDGKVLIMGGGCNPPTSTAEVIDLNSATPAWRTVGSMAYGRRQMNATLLPDGKVLATGGTSSGSCDPSGFNDATGSVYAAEMWDPATETWSTMASQQVRRLYHSTAMLLPDGRVLSAGGGLPASTTAGDVDHPNGEIYSPPYLFKGPRPTISFAPSTINYGQPFYIGTPDGTNISKVTLIRLSSVTHSFNENQRINRLSFYQWGNGVMATAPANGNLCPPGHYMLFILNGNGVPSVAQIIKVQSLEPEAGTRVIRNADNRLEVFYRGTDNAVYHNYQTTAGTNNWSSTLSLGGGVASNPVVGKNADGRLEVFVRGVDNVLWHNWQVSAGSSTWSGWFSLGGLITDDPTVAINADGRLEVFVRGVDNELWRNSQTSTGSSTWSGWACQGGSLASAPVVAANTDGRLEVFVRWADNSLYRAVQTSAGSSTWSAWSTLGGVVTSGPSVERNADGRLEVFVRGADNGLWHNWQTGAGGSSWQGWFSLGGAPLITSAFAVKANADGRLEVFNSWSDSSVYHTVQSTAGSSTWSAWSTLGGAIKSSPALERNADGRLEAFVRGADNVLWHNWQTSAGGSSWQGWFSLGGSLYSF